MDWTSIRALQIQRNAHQGSLLLDVDDPSIRDTADRLRARIREPHDTAAPRPGDVLVVDGSRLDDQGRRDALLASVGLHAHILVCGTPKSDEWFEHLGGPIAGVLAAPPNSPRRAAVWRSAFDVVLRGQTPNVTTSVAPPTALLRVTREQQREDALSAVGDALATGRISKRRQLAFLDALDGLLQHALTSAGSEPHRAGTEVRVSVAHNHHGVGVSVAELSTRRSRRQIVDSFRIGLGQRLGHVGSGELELGAAIRSSTHVAVSVTAGVATELLCYLGTGRSNAETIAPLPSVVFVNRGDPASIEAP